MHKFVEVLDNPHFFLSVSFSVCCILNLVFSFFFFVASAESYGYKSRFQAKKFTSLLNIQDFY